MSLSRLFAAVGVALALTIALVFPASAANQPYTSVPNLLTWQPVNWAQSTSATDAPQYDWGQQKNSIWMLTGPIGPSAIRACVRPISNPSNSSAPMAFTPELQGVAYNQDGMVLMDRSKTEAIIFAQYYSSAYNAWRCTVAFASNLNQNGTSLHDEAASVGENVSPWFSIQEVNGTRYFEWSMSGIASDYHIFYLELSYTHFTPAYVGFYVNSNNPTNAAGIGVLSWQSYNVQAPTGAPSLPVQPTPPPFLGPNPWPTPPDTVNG